MTFLAVSPDGTDSWVVDSADEVARLLHSGSLTKFYEIENLGQSEQLALAAAAILDDEDFRMIRKNQRELRSGGRVVATLFT